MKPLAALAVLTSALALCQSNLQFQQGAPGELPDAWFVLDGAQHAGFTAQTQHDGCHSQSPCATLTAPAGPAEGSFGTLMQSFSAEPLRGKRVRLRAWVKLEPKAAGDRAQMLLHVTRPNLEPGFVDNMADRPIVSHDWQQYEIRGEVAPDAETIAIGLTLYGAGRAWIGDVEFGAIEVETSGPEVEAARAAIEKQYARMDSAFVHGDSAEIGAVLMPGAMMRVGTIREPLLSAIQTEMAKGSKLTTHSVVSTVRLDGDEAVAIVQREAADPRADTQRTVVTTHRDTWANAENGWRMRESIEVSYHWVLPATGGDEARAVAAELKDRAVPLDAKNALADFGTAVGGARIVALGESAHGTREFAHWKEELADYLASQKGFTLMIGPNDPDLRATAARFRLLYEAYEGDTAESQAASIVRLANVTHPQAKIVLWSDNLHACDQTLRAKFGRKLYAVAFLFDRGQVRAVGVENGESRGLGVYTAPASPDGSGDAVLTAARVPGFFLNMSKLPFNGGLEHWLENLHLFHDLGAYWVVDDPAASLQPEQLAKLYDGLVYVEELHIDR